MYALFANAAFFRSSVYFLPLALLAFACFYVNEQKVNQSVVVLKCYLSWQKMLSFECLFVLFCFVFVLVRKNRERDKHSNLRAFFFSFFFSSLAPFFLIFSPPFSPFFPSLVLSFSRKLFAPQKATFGSKASISITSRVAHMCTCQCGQKWHRYLQAHWIRSELCRNESKIESFANPVEAFA